MASAGRPSCGYGTPGQRHRPGLARACARDASGKRASRPGCARGPVAFVAEPASRCGGSAEAAWLQCAWTCRNCQKRRRRGLTRFSKSASSRAPRCTFRRAHSLVRQLLQPREGSGSASLRDLRDDAPGFDQTFSCVQPATTGREASATSSGTRRIQIFLKSQARGLEPFRWPQDCASDPGYRSCGLQAAERPADDDVSKRPA